jgi:hypothetical protein
MHLKIPRQRSRKHEEVDTDAFTEYLFEDFTVYTAKDYQKKIIPTSKKEAYLFKYPWELVGVRAGLG